ncbi:hypothetical protein COX97_02575 [Candidatus Pacearchaeota archaeon CG_4_10_14_0_2_um_filter_05_32_18]|nr:MAG: hypothetical protein COX97_02575 [Candidatus Pacearchaeota archaeon CG_4_10_14_0_2_um_filter_05_32_18]
MKNQKNSLSKNVLAILTFVSIVLIIIFLYHSYSKKNYKMPVSGASTACIDNKCFYIEIADSYYGRMKGLMGREKLGKKAGYYLYFLKKIPGVFG